MASQAEPLKHVDAERKEDATLAQEASTFLSKAPAVQLVAELLTELRAKNLPWWGPDALRARHSATDRMRWFRDRADIRQQITTQLTGLGPKAARKKDPDFQASLLDSAVEDGDCTARAFEEAFDPRELAVYGPASDYWRQFRQRMPWSQDIVAHQEVMAFLLKMLLAEKGSLGLPRKAILTPWEVRTNIPGRVWHTRIPLDLRVAIDDARFEREKAKGREPFHAKDDLALAMPEVIAANIPLKEFARVLDIAERAMGFEDPTEVTTNGSKEAALLSTPPPDGNGTAKSERPPAVKLEQDDEDATRIWEDPSRIGKSKAPPPLPARSSHPVLAAVGPEEDVTARSEVTSIRRDTQPPASAQVADDADVLFDVETDEQPPTGRMRASARKA